MRTQTSLLEVPIIDIIRIFLRNNTLQKLFFLCPPLYLALLETIQIFCRYTSAGHPQIVLCVYGLGLGRGTHRQDKYIAHEL